ncbi:MAG: NfeD family protein [Deltaproteobacteria bacterium]|jgi:membrane protein implicated in regulation of membrane protease activity|nr:NfeD family protein [Deltaproteobacteria bacterium]
MDGFDFAGNAKVFWFVVGFVFLILEVATPGVLFMFFGLGAWVLLVLLAFVQVPVWLQWVIFPITSLLFLVILRQRILRFLAKRKTPKIDSLSEAMVSERYIGKEVDVVTDVSPDRPGTVEFNGTNWQGSSGASLAKGSRARILKVDGLTLVLEPLSPARAQESDPKPESKPDAEPDADAKS